MTNRRKLFDASGVLYPNPRYGQDGEPLLIGAVYCRGKDGRQHIRYEISAWRQFPDSHLDYVLKIGEGMRGVICKWWDDDRPGLDMEGTAGFDHEYIVTAWYVDLERTILSISIFSGERSPALASC